MRNSHWSRFLLTLLTVALMCARGEASLLYNFEHTGTGTIFATLELASLPATHTEVLGLSFTPEGQAVFGYGPTYLGTFDDTDGIFPVISDGFGGLRATDGSYAFMTDFDPPPGVFAVLTVALFFDVDAGQDGILLYDGVDIFGSDGNWRAITASIPGDGNGDGWVDGLDYLLWAANFGTHPGPDGDISDGDYNDDGWIDGLDYLLWAGNFGSHNTSTSVPEPSSLLLATVGLLTLVGRKWSRRYLRG